MTPRRAEITPADIVEEALQGFVSLAPYLDRNLAADVRTVITTRAYSDTD